MARRRKPPGEFVYTDVTVADPEEGIRQGIIEVRTASVDAASWHARWARRWGRVYFALGLPSAVLAGVAGATGLASTSGRIPAAIIALVAAGLGAAATFLDGARHREHHTAMSAAWQSLASDAHTHLLADVPSADWLRTDGRAALQALSRRRARLFGLTAPSADEQSPAS
ncbi:hypothetical protein Ade02nite_35890 [Paractinoplanes deccanensis]|uniref:SLATT domain-containing protein n=1 Tax=Paractinoplanes deccanensis TaxID=113561 RepID=A0ABQ3Y4P1_9ACTN|nr:hypothetical protein [Actinoplanes deccanensis]GID74948.1 hypothetical protein Ade02nite_35890 [Actinoplanes deccanensis]